MTNDELLLALKFKQGINGTIYHYPNNESDREAYREHLEEGHDVYWIDGDNHLHQGEWPLMSDQPVAFLLADGDLPDDVPEEMLLDLLVDPGYRIKTYDFTMDDDEFMINYIIEHC